MIPSIRKLAEYEAEKSDEDMRLEWDRLTTSHVDALRKLLAHDLGEGARVQLVRPDGTHNGDQDRAKILALVRSTEDEIRLFHLRHLLAEFAETEAGREVLKLVERMRGLSSPAAKIEGVQLEAAEEEIDRAICGEALSSTEVGQLKLEAEEEASRRELGKP